MDRVEFSFHVDASGIDNSCVNIEWHKDYATVIIDSPEMEAVSLEVSLD